MARKKRARKPTAKSQPKVVNPTTRKAKKPRRKVATRGAVQISACSVDYAAALMDPFDGPLACVPSQSTPLPSFKAKVWSRGIVTVGAGGRGFILVNPQLTTDSAGLGIWYTDASFAGGGSDPLTNVPTTGVINVGTNAPYAISAAVRFRLVACGIRVRYMGAELDLAGYTLAVRNPDNATLVGSTLTQCLAFDFAGWYPTTTMREYTSVVWMPADPDDEHFSSSSAGGVPCLAIWVNGTAASQFTYEVYSIVEYIGASVRGKTLSHADPSGYGAVLTAREHVIGDSYLGRTAKSVVAKLVSEAGDELSRMSGNVLRSGASIAAAAGMSYLMGRARGVMQNGLPPNQQQGPLIENVRIALPREERTEQQTHVVSAEPEFHWSDEWTTYPGGSGMVKYRAQPNGYTVQIYDHGRTGYVTEHLSTREKAERVIRQADEARRPKTETELR